LSACRREGDAISDNSTISRVQSSGLSAGIAPVTVAAVGNNLFPMGFLISRPLRASLPCWVAALLLAIICVAEAQPSTAPARARPALEPLPLEPVFRIEQADGKHLFVTSQEPGFEKLKPRVGAAVFLAVVTNRWPTGLVPVFGVEKPHGIELRRRGLAGEENTSEPLFFALPPEDEPDAANVAGRWECRAVRTPDSSNFLVWELAVEMEKISGRFDQDTEYRVASLAGGTYRSNRLELRVEYLRDAYLLAGDWRDGKLKGDWHRTDDEERGTWEATREAARPSPHGEIVRLYEWRRVSDNARHYSIEAERMAVDWERSPRPLCRVWRAKMKE
jgi:hypothetical protein